LCFINLMGMVGWTFIVPILLALIIGQWLTKVFSMSPIWIISFIFIGVTVGFINMFKEINKASRRADKRSISSKDASKK